jgi:hypothetical protein
MATVTGGALGIRRGLLNLSSLTDIDPQEVVRSGDVAALQRIVSNLVYGQVSADA